MLESNDLQKINAVFKVYDARDDGDLIRLFGEPLVEASAFYGELYPYFARRGRSVQLDYRLGEYVVTIGPAKKERVWINVVLAIATVITTTVAGAMLYGVNPFATPLEVYRGLPFSAAIMLVLGSHELSHYIASRRHGVDATLPYFIPFPLPPIGTMGAIIRQKGPVPTRRALFDVGISGPLVGLAVAVAVTVVGLLMPAPAIDQAAVEDGSFIQLNPPLLFSFLMWAVHPGEPLAAINPIAFAGWVGMLVTVLNLLPVGQLDGGHVARAVLGPIADRISRVVPPALLLLGFVGTFALGQQGGIWILWGLLTSFMSSSGHPKPTDDTQPVGWPRVAVACAALVLGLLCFTPFPFSIS